MSEDQAKVICRYAPTHHDTEVADFARLATVSQLHRTLSRYVAAPVPAPGDEPAGPVEETRRVSFGPTDTGHWRLSALLPLDQGALVEQALTSARERLSPPRRH